MSARAAVAMLAVSGMLVWGCSSDGSKGRDKAVPATTTSSTPASSEPAPRTTVPSSARPQCQKGGEVAPGTMADSSTARTDFDGDGSSDAVAFEGSEILVVPTRGERSTFRLPTAKPWVVMGGVDPDADGDQDLLIRLSGADGFEVVVATMGEDCTVGLAMNAQDEPYTFVIRGGDGVGSGLGCVDADGDGRSDLVGLQSTADGNSVRWSRTIVRLDGRDARNSRQDGGVYTRSKDDREISTLTSATCGKRVAFDDP